MFLMIYNKKSIKKILKIKREKLFDRGDWYNPGCRDILLERIENFLKKYIK
ncbi:hypothetical protein ES703_97357 [subsurface metagenome]